MNGIADTLSRKPLRTNFNLLPTLCQSSIPQSALGLSTDNSYITPDDWLQVQEASVPTREILLEELVAAGVHINPDGEISIGAQFRAWRPPVRNWAWNLHGNRQICCTWITLVGGSWTRYFTFHLINQYNQALYPFEYRLAETII